MDGQVLMEAKGTNGIVQLLQDHIRIRRPSLLGTVYGRKLETVLSFEEITSVEFKQVVGGLAGYITFHDVEGRENYEDFCVSFLKLQEPRFAALNQAIEKQRAAYQANHVLPRLKVLTTEELA